MCISISIYMYLYIFKPKKKKKFASHKGVMTLLSFAYLVVSYHVRAAYEVRRYLLNMYQFAPAAKEMWHYFYSHVNFHLLYIEKRVLFSIAD